MNAAKLCNADKLLGRGGQDVGGFQARLLAQSFKGQFAPIVFNQIADAFPQNQMKWVGDRGRFRPAVMALQCSEEAWELSGNSRHCQVTDSMLMSSSFTGASSPDHCNPSARVRNSTKGA